MNKYNKAMAATIAALVAVALAGCVPASDSGSNDSGDIKRGGIIRAGSTVPRAAPDPLTVHDPGSINVLQPVLEYLLFVEKDGTISPLLATEYDSDDGGKTWDFKLRENVTFQDGTDFTAADVKASIERIIEEDSLSSAKSSLKGILSPGGVDVVNDHEVVFHLDQQFADFPYLVSSGNYGTFITKADYSGDFLTNPIGTGPFVMTNYQSGVKATYKAYKDYWGADTVYLDGVDLQFFEDTGAYTGAMLSGSLDVTQQVQYFANGPLFDSDLVELQTAEVSGGTIIQMRTDQGPFADVRVRTAMALALDREALGLAVYGPLATPGNDTIWSAQFPEKTDIPQRTRDLKKSKELLASAGYPNGLEVTLTVPTETSKIGELVQSQSNEGGFKTTLDVMPTNTFYDQAWLNVDFGITGWAARPSVSQLINMLYKSDAVWNTAHWSNSEFDKLADELSRTVDNEKRQEIAQRLDEIVHEEIPQIVYTNAQVIQPNLKTVKNYKSSQFVYMNFRGVWLDK